MASALVVLWTVFATGCGRGLPEKADPEKARQALAKALEAWKTDGSVDKLANESPKVYFNDQKCKDGLRLVKYSIEPNHAYFGQSVRFGVLLRLQNGEAAARDRKANYLVDIANSVVIVPD